MRFQQSVRFMSAMFMFGVIAGSFMAPMARIVGAAPRNDAPSSPIAVQGSPSSPLQVSITASPLLDSSAQVTVQISTTIALDNIVLDFEVAPELRVLSGNVPQHDALAEHETKTYDLVVQGTNAKPGVIKIYAQAPFGGGTVGDAHRIMVGLRNGALEVVPDEPLALTPSVYLPLLASDARVAPTSQADTDSSPEGSSITLDKTVTITDILALTADAATTESVPESTAATSQIQVKGTYEYHDHLVRPPGASDGPAGVDPKAVLKKIRKALVYISQQKTDGSWAPISGAVSFTNNSGSYSIRVSGVTVGKTKIRATVCTMGPTAAYLLRVQQGASDENPWCMSSLGYTAQATNDFGTKLPGDSHATDGPFNIYDTALEAFDFLTANGYPPTTPLPIVWYLGNPDASHQSSGKIYLNGAAENGDQWDDSVIMHEIGHWVMRAYAAIPPLPSSYSHGDCTEGTDTPNISYTEGWASFFMAASRNGASSANPEFKKYASYYLDTRTNGVGSIGTTDVPLNQNLEGTTIFDQSTSIDFRKGNFCEWQIAGALWDVIDSNADNHDTLQKTFSSMFKASRTKFDGHYPWTINEWWYGWTDTLDNRSESSFGSVQAMLDNFADHKIQVGFRIETTWGHNPPILSGDLWLPVEHRREVNTSGENPDGSQYRQFPYAGMTYSAGPPPVETTWITSLYKGTYVYASVDYSGLAGDSGALAFSVYDARVTIYDGSKPLLQTTRVPGTAPANSYWWRVFLLDGGSGEVTFTNDFYENPPSPYNGGSSVAR